MTRTVTAWMAAALLPAALSFAAPARSAPPTQALSASIKGGELLGADANSDGVRDDLATYLRSISQDEAIETSLIFMAKARTRAMLTDVGDAGAVKAAFDEVFTAKACLSRDVGEYLYQQSLTSLLDAALLDSEPRRMAMRRAMEADRANVRQPSRDAPDCARAVNPDDIASHSTTIEMAALDGTPVKIRVYYARPSMVATSQNDDDLLGSDADADGLRDDLQRYLNLASKEPRVRRALIHKARADTAALLTDPDDADAVRGVWRKQIEAHACVARDIEQRRQRHQLTRRLDLHLLNTAPRAIAMRAVNQAMHALRAEAQAIAAIRCGLPETLER